MLSCDPFSNTRNISHTCAVKMRLRKGWHPQTCDDGQSHRFALKVCHEKTIMQLGYRDAERLNLPNWTVFSTCRWIQGSLIERLDMSTAQTAALGAGEVFLDMRGSSSFSGVEGFKEKRGECSFKAFWRLAAVGTAVVFPKRKKKKN